MAGSGVRVVRQTFVSSGKEDLMPMVASRRAGPVALLDLRPITTPFYPNDFVAYPLDPTALITGLDDAKATAQSLLSTSAVALSGSAFRSDSDPGPWDQLAFAALTCLLFVAKAGTPAGAAVVTFSGSYGQRAVRLSRSPASCHSTTRTCRRYPRGPDAALRAWQRDYAKDHPRRGYRPAYHDARDPTPGRHVLATTTTFSYRCRRDPGPKTTTSATQT